MNSAAEERWKKIRERMRREEHGLLTEAFRATGWSFRATARYLGIPYSTLQHVMVRHPEIERVRLAMAEKKERAADAA